jgi:hypothetical protein
MTSKPDQSQPRPEKPVRKYRKGSTETSRLFLDIDELIRRPLAAPLTRYVE